MSLTDDLLSQLQGAPLQQVSQQLGIDSQQASTAISAALPLLMGALGNNAAKPQGAEALFGALQNNHSGLDIGSVLGAVMGGGNSPAANGAGILGHIFGGNQDRAETGLAQATGLSPSTSSQLLKILAPIVMAYIAQRMSSGGAAANPDGLAQVLGQEKQQVAQAGGIGGGLLGSVLDQDGDGQFGVSDLIKLGSGLLGSGKR
ncbi:MULTISPECIES: DUF937 domain-containing protein [Stenotrophomonas]|uniref:DUF937 domain-containing protein n=1 Tax=Stenotrophomonas TaxID=40323 RepID=UPI0007700548|nr:MULTISPECIES: DUF937 domain-containing protein [Stenotrophomonas]AMJ57225.1 calcium-binding protein [Stenotrophomonas sp. KCTC 12332]